jgi:hypothetical protein
MDSILEEHQVETPAGDRDAVLSRAREAVSRIGRSHGFLGNDQPEAMSLAAMLRAVSTQWVGAPDPAGEVLLREHLLAFARTFELDVCPSGDPECYCIRLDRGDARDVLRTIADVWHGRSGNPGPDPDDPSMPRISPAILAEMAEDHAHNLRVLDGLALFLDPERAPALRAVVAQARDAEGGAWLLEARAMATEALASWVPNPSSLAEVGRVLVSALSVAFHADWTSVDAADLEQAAADACAGVLVRGIAHESVTAALFAPIGAAIALADLDAFADTEILAAA